MPVLVFDYTSKSSTTPKPRVAVPIKSPYDRYFTVDITELDPTDQGTFTSEFKELEDEHSKKIAELMEKYDIKHSYRYFLPESMQNLQIEEDM